MSCSPSALEELGLKLGLVCKPVTALWEAEGGGSQIQAYLGHLSETLSQKNAKGRVSSVRRPQVLSPILANKTNPNLPKIRNFAPHPGAAREGPSLGLKHCAPPPARRLPTAHARWGEVVGCVLTRARLAAGGGCCFLPCPQPPLVMCVFRHRGPNRRRRGPRCLARRGTRPRPLRLLGVGGGVAGSAFAAAAVTDRASRAAGSFPPAPRPGLRRRLPR